MTTTSYADAPSYVKAIFSWEAVANHAIVAKKDKYHLAIEDLRSSFIPLECSTDGAIHREYAAYTKWLACRLAGKWGKLFFLVMDWVHAKTQFAIFQAVDLRLCGTHHRIQSLRLQDGVVIRVGH